MKCPKCGSSRLVDNGNGKKCVNCDFEWTPRKTGCGTWLVLIIIIFYCLNYIGNKSLEMAQQKEEEQKAANVQRIMNEAENASVESNQPKMNNSSNNQNTNKRLQNFLPKNYKSNNNTSQNKSNSESILNAFGVWKVTAEDDEFNGNKNIYFYNKSLDSFTGNFNLKHNPVLTVRCKDNEIGITVNFEDVMDPTENFTGVKIGLKFDDDKPYYEIWHMLGTSYDAVTAINPVDLLNKMANKKKLILKFKPYQMSDVNVKFDLTGIDKVKDKIDSICRRMEYNQQQMRRQQEQMMQEMRRQQQMQYE